MFKGLKKQFAHKPYRWIRACVICEELLFLHEPLCRICRKSLYQEFFAHKDEVSFFPVQGRSIPVFYLWHWEDHNSYVLRKLIVSLKDGHNPRLYNLFIHWMELKLLHHNVRISHNIFAVPSQRRHSKQLGYCLSKAFNAGFYDILVNQSTRSQKSKKKLERKNARVSINKDKVYDLDLEKSGVLADDVMVTGESLKACVKALDPIHIEYIVVWAEKSVTEETFFG